MKQINRYLRFITTAYLIICVGLSAFAPVLTYADNLTAPIFSKVADKTIASPGDFITYTITVHNPNSVELEWVHFQDQLPETVTFDHFISNPGTTASNSSDNSLITWPYVFIGPGETKIYEYAVKINSDVTDGTVITNHASSRYCFVYDCHQAPDVSASVLVVIPTITYPQCSDGIDNDGDGKIDFPNDPGCTNTEDNDETDPVQNNIPDTCSVPNAGGDTDKVVVQNLHNEVNTLQVMLNSITTGIDVTLDQKNYQTWGMSQASTTLKVKYEANGAGGSIVFGYHKAGDTTTFAPLFKTGGYVGFESTPTISLGQTISVNILDQSAIAFAIKSSDTGKPFFSTENSKNADGFRHAVVYDLKSTSYPTSYIIGFEDLTNLGDHDYNDIVVIASFPNCGSKTVPPTNTPPTIHIIGANPLNLFVGDTFTDPGATATDTEDGDLTSHIMVTGSVNTSTTSTSTLVYSVTDSGGLSASTTRVVIVSATTTPVATTTPNIAVTKTADKSSANAGDTVTYTIVAANLGTASSTGVTVTDMLPTSLDFVSASTTVGSYSTSTGLWTIGNFANGSSTTLIIVATIKAGTEGQKITNTAVATSTASDSNLSDNTTSVDINVNTPSGGGGGGNGGGGDGGGGGGGSSSSGGRHRDISGLVSTGGGQVLGATSCSYLRDYLRRDWNNDPAEVLKLQSFLNVFEGEKLSYTTVFDEATFQAVSRFQNKYFDDILEPWGHTAPTGFVYILTKKKINEIYCNTIYTLTPEQKQEIAAFRAFLMSLRAGGADIPDIYGTVGLGGEDKPVILTPDMADATQTDEESGGILSNNILRNAAISLFAIPENLSGALKCLVVLLVILAVIYALASLFAGGSGVNEIERAKVGRRKLVWSAIGILLAIVIATIVSYFCIVIPLAIIFLIILGMLIFGNHKNMVNASSKTSPAPTSLPKIPVNPATEASADSYDKSLEELVDAAKKEEVKETQAEGEDSKKGFKGILDN